MSRQPTSEASVGGTQRRVAQWVAAAMDKRKLPVPRADGALAKVDRSDVAVLFVDRLGVYPKLGVQWWDEARDATKYDGHGPVVAHPPCGPYCRLRHLSKHDDPKHALFAVERVRRLGGILEHPANSKLWEVDFEGGRPVETDRHGQPLAKVPA